MFGVRECFITEEDEDTKSRQRRENKCLHGSRQGDSWNLHNKGRICGLLDQCVACI